MKLKTFVAVLSLLGFASNASAVILTGGPNYALPGGGSCTVTGGTFTTVGGGATVTCSGINLAAHSKVYIGLRVDQSPNGNTMTGVNPAASGAEVFRFSTSGGSNITYVTLATPATTFWTGSPGALGNSPGTAISTLTLTRTVGTATVVAAGGNPANNSNGDVGALFQVTSGSSITFDVDITATRSPLASGQASSVYDALHATAGGGGERSRVDMAFYWSDCGDGVVDSPVETCDQGGANGTLGSCCSSTCTFKPNTTPCTDDGNQCTNDQCNGASVTCMHPPMINGTPCVGNGAGECSGADTCNGSGTCLNNDLASGTICTDTALPAGGDCKIARCNGSNVCNQNFGNETNGTGCADGDFCNGNDQCTGGLCATHAGDPCDGPDGDGDCAETCVDTGYETGNCNGTDTNGSSCTDGAFCTGTETCTGGVCGSSTGDPCPGPDNDTNCSETCDEGANDCNGADTDGTLCRADTGECDVQETCLAGACPANGFEPNGEPCGSGTDTDCDNPDTCNGSNVCLQNLELNGEPCGDSSDTTCTDPDSCDGSGTCEDNHAPNSTICRAASAGQECDAVENCDGAGNCPADGVLAASTICRGLQGDCDLVEVCDGVDSDCPPDLFEASSVVCRADLGDCDIGENCPGNGPNCPADVLEDPGTACGSPGNTDCDNPDTCDGNNNCLINNEPSGTTCTSDGETCTVDECDGAATCTHLAGNSGTECRPQAGGQLCDEPEECDGVNTTCPADDVKPNGAVCRADLGECDTGENCDGVSSACPPDVSEPDGTPCGDGTNDVCTDPDTCESAVCDGNHEPTSVQCRAASAGQLCDAAEFCDGAGNCPADAPATSGTECRPEAGVCDVAETCDGSSFDCPAVDGKSTGVCRPSAGDCDLPDSCDGINDDCPVFDAKSTDECRPAANQCDVAEDCDGINNACPTNLFQANGTPCPDALFCNGAETCQTGICSAGTDPCAEFCDEPTDMCLASSCASAPLMTCRTASKGLLLIKNNDTDDGKDRLVWKWLKGMATSQTDFADPTDMAHYGLCIYDGGNNLIGTMDVPPSNKWAAISDKGYKFFDLNSESDGAFKIKLKGSTQPKSKALVKGRGVGLPDPLSATPLVTPVKVQLVNNQTGICFESVFSTPKLNTDKKFKAKAP